MSALTLPAWAENDEGRALVERIIAERPDCFIRRGTWIEGGGVKVYRGRTAGQLRAMHDAWLTREFAALDAQFHVTNVWDQGASNALHRTEDGNQLIDRILRETAERADLDPTPIGDGRFQVAA